MCSPGAGPPTPNAELLWYPSPFPPAGDLTPSGHARIPWQGDMAHYRAQLLRLINGPPPPASAGSSKSISPAVGPAVKVELSRRQLMAAARGDEEAPNPTAEQAAQVCPALAALLLLLLLHHRLPFLTECVEVVKWSAFLGCFLRPPGARRRAGGVPRHGRGAAVSAPRQRRRRLVGAARAAQDVRGAPLAGHAAHRLRAGVPVPAGVVLRAVRVGECHRPGGAYEASSCS